MASESGDGTEEVVARQEETTAVVATKKKPKRVPAAQKAKAKYQADRKRERKFLAVCKKHEGKTNDKVLEQELPDWSLETRKNQGRLALFLVDEEIRYEPCKIDNARFTGLSKAAMLVFQLVKQSGNMGIRAKELKAKSNLGAQMPKILNALRARKLIRSKQSLMHKGGRVWMLTEVEPSPAVIGSVWGKEGVTEYEEALVDAVAVIIKKFLTKQGTATTAEIAEHVRASDSIQVNCSDSDVQNVIAALVYDGLVEFAPGTVPIEQHRELALLPDLLPPSGADPPKWKPHRGRRKSWTVEPSETVVMEVLPQYQLAKHEPEPSELADIPCNTCPVAHECKEDEASFVSPAHCVYFDTWFMQDEEYASFRAEQLATMRAEQEAEVRAVEAAKAEFRRKKGLRPMHPQQQQEPAEESKALVKTEQPLQIKSDPELMSFGEIQLPMPQQQTSSQPQQELKNQPEPKQPKQEPEPALPKYGLPQRRWGVSFSSAGDSGSGSGSGSGAGSDSSSGSGSHVEASSSGSAGLGLPVLKLSSEAAARAKHTAAAAAAAGLRGAADRKFKSEPTDMDLSW